ncbi:MAG: hypothetical protein ACYTKD_08840 [Planctomycetota bacterium]|jgi:hypothetical protein
MAEADETSPARRFPYAAAALASAAVGVAAWVWMTHSYAWPITVADLWVRERPAGHPFGPGLVPRWADASILQQYPNSALVGTYVRLRHSGREIVIDDERHPLPETVETKGRRRRNLILGRGESLVGRVVWTDRGASICPTLGLDTAASRFTGASVAGIVVAAWCSFVFGLMLRRWLRARRERPHADRTEAACGDAGAA